MKRAATIAILAILGGCGSAPGDCDARFRGEVRYVPDGDLTIIDPFVSTSSVTMSHAYMVYDTLFALDGEGRPRPQMVGKFRHDDDFRTWHFRLRPGLAFHDGAKVRSTDVVASLQRWLQVSLYRSFLEPSLVAISPTGPDSFEIRFSRPMPNLPEALAEPTRPTFVMRAVDARQPATMPVRNAIGSGPFIMEMDRWIRGIRVRYRRNPAYVSRREPADNYAGAKQVQVETVSWEIIEDANTALQALGNGEVDIIEAPHPDLLGLVRGDPAIRTEVINRLGQQIVLRPNSLAPPLDRTDVRRVLLYALDQRAYLAATGVEPDRRRTCWQVLTCVGPYGSQAGIGDWAARNGSPDRARQMLKASSYRGETIVILNPVDMPSLSAAAMITAQSLRDVGFIIDLQAVDGSTFFARRAVRRAPSVDRAGWHIFHSVNSGSNASSVVLNPGAQSACKGEGWFGWPCDPRLNEIRSDYFFAADEAARKKAARELQARFYQKVPYVPLGEFSSSVAMRSTITQIAPAPRVVFWGMRKAEAAGRCRAEAK